MTSRFLKVGGWFINMDEVLCIRPVCNDPHNDDAVRQVIVTFKTKVGPFDSNEVSFSAIDEIVTLMAWLDKNCEMHNGKLEWAQQVMVRFANAADKFAFKGAAPPYERPAIQEEYVAAGLQLLRAIVGSADRTQAELILSLVKHKPRP